MKRLACAALLLGATACGSPAGSGDPMNPVGTGGGGAAGGGAAGTGAVAGAAGTGVGGLTPAPSWADLPAVVTPDPELGILSSREKQYDKLCATPRNDSFFKLVCGGVRPNIPDLASLLSLVGLDQDRAFALNGNSTSLVAKSVSALNPRIVVFPRVDADLDQKDDFMIVGFVRGERFVEVTSRDPMSGEPNFYLLSFEQACDYQGNCDLASRLTEEIEHNWTAYSIYPESELENTSFDCLACHRPGGFGTKKILRMQELSSPWLHWFPQRFVQRTDSDRILSAQFADVHGVDMQYGGVPIATIQNALDDGSGAQLEALIRAEGYGDQPNVFDPRIEAEAKNGDQSPTWLAQWTLATQGGAITVPYPRVDVTDEAKRTAATAAYKGVVMGTAGRDTLVDLRDVFSQDATEKLSFVPQAGADGHAVLVQMCSRCHDGRADPEIGRSNFNVLSLDKMSTDEKQVAASRLQEPEGSVKKMPPWRSGQLTPEALQAALTELAK
jgi:Cytochrome C oxidase, cbb3-type, subunit III